MPHDELEQMQMALRYIYEHGLEHSGKRPTWLNQVIDKAWRPYREGSVKAGYPPRDMQLPN
jgi:hypothetical protein